MGEIDLRALADRLEIQDVLARYCRGVDRGEPELLRSVYHEGAIDRHGPMEFDEAKTQFAATAVPAVDAWKNQCQHTISNTVIELDGDVAFVETYYLAYQPIPQEDGSEITGLIGGRYLDRFERRDDRWAIAERNVILDWSRALAPEPLVADGEYPGPGRRDADPSHTMFAGLRARLAAEDTRTPA